MLNSVQQRNALRKSFTRFANAHALSLIADSPDFVDDCLSACYSEALGEGAECRSEADFNEELRDAKSRLVTLGDRLAALLEQCLLTRLTLRQRLQGLSSGPEYLQRDVEGQLAGLFGGNFVRNHGFSRLREYPRYLEAITLRLSKAPFMGPRDESETQWLASCQYRLQSLHAQTERPAPQLVRALDDLRWLLEEYRVSVFAQNLKTKVSVSPKRVEKAFEAAEKLAVET
jgi:ATP-dependent helicase HrpA